MYTESLLYTDTVDNNWKLIQRILYIDTFYQLVSVIDILNKDCRRSISAILTWVLENVKISARPLNSIGN